MNKQIFRKVIVALALLGIATLGVGCTLQPKPDPDPAIRAITFKGGDFHFEAPTQVPAGLVLITFENVGKEAHHMELVELNDGASIDQLLAAFPQGEAALVPLLKGSVGGPGPILPGGSQRVTVNVTPGEYALLCFLPDDQGVPHLMKGMVAPLSVVGSAPANQAEPVANGTVTLKDFSFTLPDAIKAGKQTWKIVNEGTQPHEIVLIKLAEGKTLDDVIVFSHNPQGQPPHEEAGGFQGINPDKVGWLHLDLTPGNYVALCYIPDAATGKPHLELGMMQTFTVNP